MHYFEYDVPLRVTLPWFVALVAILIGVYAVANRRRKGSKL